MRKKRAENTILWDLLYVALVLLGMPFLGGIFYLVYIVVITFTFMYLADKVFNG